MKSNFERVSGPALRRYANRPSSGDGRSEVQAIFLCQHHPFEHGGAPETMHH